VRARQCYDHALDAVAHHADVGMQALVRRWHVETLLALDNQPNHVRLEMPRRSAIMLEISRRPPRLARHVEGREITGRLLKSGHARA